MSFLSQPLFLLPEQEVLHVGVLLVFQKVTGALPLLPHPRSGSTASPLEPANGQEPEKSCEMEKAWPLILLEAIRGETPSEAERALWNLQLDIEVIATAYTINTHIRVDYASIC